MEQSLRPNAFVPTASRSGSNQPTLFRAANGFVRGFGDNTYFECYGGSLNLAESVPPVAATGTVAFSPSSRTVTGTGTSFFNELRRGQMLITLAGEVLVVEEVLSATTFRAHESPATTESGVAVYRMPVLFEMANARGSLLSGRALEYDRGTILCVGSGTLRKNGTALTNSLSADRQAKVALYDSGGTYTIQQLGFPSVPIGITVTSGTGPSAKTFADTDVTTGTDNINITGHGFNNGQKVAASNSGGALPSGLADNTMYYVIRVDADNIKLATSLANAVGTPVPVDITAASGGGTHTLTPQTKAMPGGERSIRVSKASTKLGAPSFGNPGAPIKVTITSGQIIAITFTRMDSDGDATNPHDAWRIDVSLFGGSTDQSTANANSGPWYYAVTVSAADLGGTSGGTYYLEYLDAELTAGAVLTSFDNDVPPRAESVAALAQVPILVSCNGKGTPDYPTADAPGSSIVPFKMSNLAAAPLVFDTGFRNEIPLSPPEVIIGSYSAAGRLYLMTANTLQIAAFTENPIAPISTRPFWKSGFKNPYALCFANDRLYGFTNSPIRSPEDGTDASVDRSFGAFVKELTYSWHASRVFVVHDPQNECVCFVYSAAYQNEDGFWVSVVLPFMLELDAWSPPIILSDAAKDCIVSGVATVNNQFEFLMGGRDGVGGVAVGTYRFDGGLNAGETIDWYLAFQYSDAGAEMRPKLIKYPRVTGKGKDRTLGVHGSDVGESIDVAALEAGNAGAKSGSVAIDDALQITTSERAQIAIAGLSKYTIRVDGVYDGAETDDFGFPVRDSVHEVAFDEVIQGVRR